MWNREIKRRTKIDKEKWLLGQVQEGMTLKDKWDGTKVLRQEYKPNVYARKDKDGQEVDLDGRAEAMATYLEAVHWGGDGEKGASQNTWLQEDVVKEIEGFLKESRDKSTINIELDAPIERAELDKCLGKLKRGKAAGADGMTANWVKDLNDANRQKLLNMLNKWWERREWPSKMQEARIAAIYKKGNPEEPENYRPLSLLNTLFKVMAAIIKNRVEGELEKQIGETQFGFRKGKGTTQAIYVARRLQEFAERVGLRAQFVFLVWEKAFDKIFHGWLMEALKSYGLPEGILKMSGAIYENPMFYVEVDGDKSSL